jgi:predicted nucleotidyltransferase component of viral defense system
MENINEDINCYASHTQRDVLMGLLMHPAIEENFFLTGGTALSVFYLHHRLSNDLDLFTSVMLDLSEIDFWLKTKWLKEIVKIKEAPQFLSLLIKDVKIDFVIDPLSASVERKRFGFENGHHLSVDTITNIASNKLCTVVSRIEPKDFIDFYMIMKAIPDFEIKDIYQHSKSKDAIFDDPPTAAFQLETGIAFLKENPSVMPQMLIQVDFQDFFEFYENLAKWLYGLLRL